jgi:hypothetical protein
MPIKLPSFPSRSAHVSCSTSRNDTRRNSTYLSLTRAIKLYSKIQVYSEDNRNELGEDFLTRDDWDTLRELQTALEPFWSTTQWLQGQATTGHHGAIWEASIRAMSGILTRLAVGANSGLLRGLLTSAFDICLLFWHPRFWQKGQGEARRRPNFPSWCWAGWSGVAVLLPPEKKSTPGGDPKTWLLTCTEDIAYYVYDSSSSSSYSSFVDKGG